MLSSKTTNQVQRGDNVNACISLGFNKSNPFYLYFLWKEWFSFPNRGTSVDAQIILNFRVVCDYTKYTRWISEHQYKWIKKRLWVKLTCPVTLSFIMLKISGYSICTLSSYPSHISVIIGKHRRFVYMLKFPWPSVSYFHKSFIVRVASVPPSRPWIKRLVGSRFLRTLSCM